MQLKENNNYKSHKLYKGFIDKDALLEMTDGGLHYYEAILGELIPNTSTTMRSVINMFRGEQTPSLSIYKWKDKWLFKDHGDYEWQGDVFKFAALVNELDVKNEFRKVCEEIVDTLDLDMSELTTKELSDFQMKELEYLKFIEVTSDDDGGYKTAHSYFKQYGVTEDVLREYRVKAIDKVITKQGEHTAIIPKAAGSILISYSASSFAKLYQPDPKKFRYVGTKPTEHIFGWFQLESRIDKSLKKNILIITGGEKDVLTLTSLGYDAICFNSETSSIPRKAINDIFPLYENVIVMYDIDEPGRNASKKLCKQHDLKQCILPESLLQKGGKDISDYIKLGFDKDDLRRLISEADTPITEEKQQESVLTDPLFPTDIFEKLPATLQDICNQFDEQRSKDIVLLSSLTALSACFPRVQGLYRNQTNGVNLYSFITAPASSGKGVSKYGGMLVDKIQEALLQENDIKRKEYEFLLSLYQKSKEKTVDDLPIVPPEKFMFIPADTSSSKIIEMLDDNQNFGLMFETEADTLSNVIKTDWGDFTTTLRKVFHHEKVELARKSGKTYYSVKKPHLSVLLTGTPKQITTLIDDVENGFFSRFLYYNYNQTVEWCNPFLDNDRNLDEVFEGYSLRVFKWWNSQMSCKHDTMVNLKLDQQIGFSNYYQQKTHILNELLGKDAIANVRRMALCNYRLCMLLSAIRYIEENDTLPISLTVTDADFEIARKIMDTLFVHLKSVFQLVQGCVVKNKLSSQENKLYIKLPDNFTASELTTIAKQLELPQSTYEKYVRKMIKLGLLDKPKHGYYEKVA